MTTGNTVSKLQGLLDEIADPVLKNQIEDEIERLLKPVKFGLVFEEHTPEVLPLPKVQPRVGFFVVIKGEDYRCVWRVEEMSDTHAKLMRGFGQVQEKRDELLENLEVVRRLGEPIYPKLTSIMEPLHQSEGQPFHTIIEADNYHALQLLQWGYAGKFDVIYIDPPYNTGNRDWKYNNDYVDEKDGCRHSKWLSMMQKRLNQARILLKEDGVLICAIDDWELFHLGALFEQLFPAYDHVTVTVVHNERGTKSNNFAFCHEVLIFLIPRDQSVIQKRRIREEDQKEWKLRMWGANSLRSQRRGMFHSIIVEGNQVVGVGEVPDDNFHPAAPIEEKNGQLLFWPIDVQNVERRWRWSKSKICDESHRLSIREVSGRKEIFIRGEEEYLKTVWRDAKFDSSTYGSRLVKTILQKEFPYPKSLYSVKEALEAVVSNRPNALILDFFAGSGTTLHATALLNAEDGGNRRCVLVTNNEIGEAKEKRFKARGLEPGDDEWDKEGICRSITIPRCQYALRGQRDDGTPLPGSYLSGREMSEGLPGNLCAYRLDFLDPLRVERGCHFEDIAPILWLMAGAQGESNPHRENDYGVLFDERVWWLPQGAPLSVLLDEHAFSEFLIALQQRAAQAPALNLIGLVTDSQNAFNEMKDAVSELAPKADVRQLYCDYLINFRLSDSNLLEEKPPLERLREQPAAQPSTEALP